MHQNEALLTKFYTCFQNKDYQGMQACYADNATFSDPVFQDLNANEVKAMWEMLCKRGKDLRIEFSDVEANDNEGSASWTAWYTFSQTGKKVVNRVKAQFEFENGKIAAHRDYFDFYKWASQALGVPGLLLGWTTMMKKKVRKGAKENLAKFMSKQ